MAYTSSTTDSIKSGVMECKAVTAYFVLGMILAIIGLIGHIYFKNFSFGVSNLVSNIVCVLIITAIGGWACNRFFDKQNIVNIVFIVLVLSQLSILVSTLVNSRKISLALALGAK